MVNFTSFAYPSRTGTALRIDRDRFDDVLNVKEFGAKGDGTTNDTAAIQAAVTAATAAGKMLVFPDPSPSYLINAKIEINDSSGWAIVGLSGRVLINQATANTPIFHLNTKNTAGNQITGFRIENFAGQWSANQAYGNLLATVVEFDSDVANGTIADFIIENIENINGCRAVGIRQFAQVTGFTNTLMVGTVAAWGAEYRHIRCSLASSGAALFLNTQALVQHNVRIAHVHVQQTTSREEAIVVANADGLVIDNLELTSTRGQFLYLGDCRNVSVRTLRADSANINANISPSTSNAGLIGLHNAQQTRIDGITFQNCVKSTNVNLIVGDGTTSVMASGFLETTPTGAFSIFKFANLGGATCTFLQLPLPTTNPGDASGTLWQDTAANNVLKVGTASTALAPTVFDPWNPTSIAEAKAERTLTIDYTFGSAATAPLGAPITNISQVNALFWNNFSSLQPNSQSNGNLNRYHQEWQTFNGTTNMSLNPTDILLQARLDARVNTDAKVATLQQQATNNVNITGAGSYSFTIAAGLDWTAGEPVLFADHAFGDGTITSYNAGTGALVINATNVQFPGSGGSVSSPWYITRAMITAPCLRTKNTFLYGLIEGVIWTPPGNGFIPQFWLFPDNGAVNGGTKSEIDIFEQLCGNSERGLDGTYSWASAGQQTIGDDVLFNTDDIKPCYDLRNANQMNGGNFVPRGALLWHHSDFDCTTGFHKYQALWVPGYVTYYIDDRPFLTYQHSWKTAHGQTSDFAQLFLNFSIGISGANFAGSPNSVAQFPGNLRCQYIRIWQSASEIAYGNLIKSTVNTTSIIGGPHLLTGWSQVQSTLVTNAGVNSSGQTSAARITEDTGVSLQHYITQNLTLLPSQTYSASIEVHVGSSGTRNIWVDLTQSDFANGIWAAFNPSTGAVVESGVVGTATLATASFTNLGNGWFRVFITGVYGSIGSASILYGLTSSNFSGRFYTGDGTSNILVDNPRVILGTTP